MHKKKGFTLTELLAVIAIVAILTVAAISGFGAMNNNSKKKALEQKISQIELAAEKYAKENNVQSSQTISINKLILMGYLQPDSTTTDGLAVLSNPVDNDNLVCNLVTIKIENDGYKAVFIENQRDCNIAREELIDSNIDVQVYKLNTETNRDVTRIENSNEFMWIEDEVLISVSSEEYESKARSITYEWGGNVITKNVLDENRSKTISTGTTYDANNYYNEIAIRNFGAMFNGPINIMYNMKDGSTRSLKIIIKIDMEAPMGYSTVANDTSEDSTKLVNLYFDDGAGSGVDGYYYSLNKNVVGDYIGRGNKEYIDGDVEIKYGNDNGTMKVYRGSYYIRVVDAVGNISEPVLVDVNNFDKNDLSCDIGVYALSGGYIEREDKWYNSPIVLRAETVNPTGDFGAKYNFLETSNDLIESQLTESIKPNQKMYSQIKKSADMDVTSYKAALKGSSNKNAGIIRCSNRAGIDTIPPTSTVEINEPGTWAKRHTVTITINDERSGFKAGNDGKVSFEYGWSTSKTVAPTDWNSGKATYTTAGNNKEIKAVLDEGAGMSGEYYFWLKGSSVHDMALNDLANNIYKDIVRFDNTNPSCESAGDNYNWKTGSVTIEKKCSDAHSECNDASATKYETFSNTAQTETVSAYEIEDNAGNKTSCSARTASIMLDNTNPTCSLSLQAKSGTSNVDVKITRDDGTISSGIAAYGIGSYDNQETKFHNASAATAYTGYVKDGVDNSATCTITVNKLTYDNAGGSGCDYKYGINGGKWGALCTPSNGTKTFKGWYTQVNGGGTKVDANTDVSGNLTVYAKWNSKVTVNLNSGSILAGGTNHGTRATFEADASGNVSFTISAASSSEYGIGNKADISISCGNGVTASKGNISLASDDKSTSIPIYLGNINNDSTCNINLPHCTWWKNTHSSYHYVLYEGSGYSGGTDTENPTCVCAINGWWKPSGETQYGALIINRNTFMYKKYSFTTSEHHNSSAWRSGACSSYYIKKHT